jgi:hypothetical protein
MPKIVYKGQKLIVLVIVKTIATIIANKAKVPLIVLVKYKPIKRAAIINLTALSLAPIFFFINTYFNLMMTKRQSFKIK